MFIVHMCSDVDGSHLICAVPHVNDLMQYAVILYIENFFNWLEFLYYCIEATFL